MFSPLGEAFPLGDAASYECLRHKTLQHSSTGLLQFLLQGDALYLYSHRVVRAGKII